MSVCYGMLRMSAALTQYLYSIKEFLLQGAGEFWWDVGVLLAIVVSTLIESLLHHFDAKFVA